MGRIVLIDALEGRSIVRQFDAWICQIEVISDG
jgi:hypothetical protein